jgi:predicted nucleic acid-binding protein
MAIIIDASGAAEILLKKEKAGQFSLLLHNASLVLAPDLYIPELSNVLWKYYRAKKYTQDECEQFINDGIDYIDIFIDSKKIWQEAFTESIKNNHSAYDMFYFVAARRNNAMLMTTNSALISICEKNHIQVC